MTNISWAAIGAAFLFLTFTDPTTAHDFAIGDLRIGHPWSRATPPGAKVGGGYLKIDNNGAVPDRLISAAMEYSGRVEIHEMSINDGVMRMRELTNGIVIAPGHSMELKPGGLHIMFMDLNSPLRQGDTLKGSLTFEKAGTVAVEFVVDAIGAPGNPAAHAH
jgi:periplasmic copper chaperone A